MTSIIFLQQQIRHLLQFLTTSGGQPLANFLLSLEINEEKVRMIFESPLAQLAEIEKLRQEAESRVKAMEGVTDVQSLLTTQRLAQQSAGRPVSLKSRERASLPNVHKIIAIASGKGGVGKSTTAANLAIAFLQAGQKTGLLDADIYGPSLPRLFSITDKPVVNSEKKLVPILSYGIHCMSMGFMIPEDSAVVWRGPMVHSALQQMLNEVAWPELDILVVDMPPGTGDTHLTLCQRVHLQGAVIVSTPQDIALIDARKGINMFGKVGVPVLGIIENMSQFSCPNCGHVSEIFSHGGARKEAQMLSIPFLGELPLDVAIRHYSDSGIPVTIAEPASAIACLYRDIAQKILDMLS